MVRQLYVLVDPTFLQAISLDGRGINDFLSHLVRHPCTSVTTSCVLQNLSWDLSDKAEDIMYGLEPFSGGVSAGVKIVEPTVAAPPVEKPKRKEAQRVAGKLKGKEKVERGDVTDQAGKVEAQPAAKKLKSKEKKRKRCRKGRGTMGTMKLSRLLLWNV